MLIELTPRSAEIIAHEQKQRGATSPEHLIEQALEALADRSDEPAWFHADAAEEHRILMEGLADADNGRVHPAEEVLRDMYLIAGIE